MFGLSTELKEARKQLEDAESALTDITRSHENTIADMKSKTERDRLDLNSAHQREINNKNDEIKSLTNKVSRIEAEMEARLNSQGEFLELEFTAKRTAVGIEMDAQKEAFETKERALTVLAEAKAEKILADAEVKGTKIIQEALENVQVVYKNILDVLTDKLANLTEVDISDISDLVRAATEGYPSFPDTVSSSSNSLSK